VNVKLCGKFHIFTSIQRVMQYVLHTYQPLSSRLACQRLDNLGKAHPICYYVRMSKYEKLYEHILMRRSDVNVPFDGLCAILKRIGFAERIKGDHYIFTMDSVEEIINL